jgi:hypothetical protein
MYVPADPAETCERGWVDPEHPGDTNELRYGRYGLVAEPLEDDGFMAEWNGDRWMCPRNARLRMLQGVLAFHNAYAEAGGHLVIPEAMARVAADELERIRHDHPEIRSHILTSAWHVPPRWFLCFSPDEKEMVEVAGHPTIRYRTSQSSAILRVRRALDALHRAGFTRAITGDIEELFEWLEGFVLDSCMVELDYASVAELFPVSQLAMDDSAQEIWESVEALERGDLTEAQERYFELAGRWSLAMSVGQHS